MKSLLGLVFFIFSINFAQAEDKSTSAPPPQTWDEIKLEQMPHSLSANVEVLQFFWYGCSHCENLEPYVDAWLKRKAPYIKVRRIPITWSADAIGHARLYFTLQKLDRLDLSPLVFKTILREKNSLVGKTDEETLQRQSAFATKNGIDAESFKRIFYSSEVEEALKEAHESALMYEINVIPAFVIGNHFRTDILKAQTPERLFSIIDLLSKREHEDIDKHGESSKGR